MIFFSLSFLGGFPYGLFPLMELVKWRRWSNHGRHSSGSIAANSLCLAASNSSWNMLRYRTARVVSSTNNQLLTNYQEARHRPSFIFNPVKNSVKPLKTLFNEKGEETKWNEISWSVIFLMFFPACPACLGPTFFHGNNVVNGGVPVYAIVREYQDAWKTVDVVYHTFYPYNRGKQVCIGRLYTYGNWLIQDKLVS
jgi:hypothetical protein